MLIFTKPLVIVEWNKCIKPVAKIKFTTSVPCLIVVSGRLVVICSDIYFREIEFFNEADTLE